MAGSGLDKVFVSVYAITETNTTPAKLRICGRGSSPCFQGIGTLLRGRDMKCYIKLKTDCSLAKMVAGAMFEFVIDSELQPLHLFFFYV